MNLNKRALFLIIPVVFLSFLVASSAFYWSLEKTIRGLEENRLELAITELTTSFHQYSTFAESYLEATLQNTALRRFLSSQDSQYKQVSLGTAITKATGKFKHHRSDRLSFLIVDHINMEKPKEQFFFEISDDPFSNLSSGLRRDYESFIASNNSRVWGYTQEPDGTGKITTSRIVDRITLFEPTDIASNNSVLLQLAVEPTRYLELKKSLIETYQADISYNKVLPNNSYAFRNKAYLGPGEVLFIDVPESYLTERLLPVRATIILVSIALFFVSALILLHLVKRYITGPIESLESQLSNVVDQHQDNISISHIGNDEVGRLQRTFHKLYGELATAYKRTKQLAERDPLTQLHNMSYIHEQAANAIEEAREKDECVALIYIDLDNFKFVNDKYGHDVGDALLQAFAARLSSAVRSEDLVCSKKMPLASPGRIAGDEFSVVVRGIHDATVPEQIGKRVLSLFKEGFHFDKGQFPVSASIGISMYPADGDTLAELLANADNAMYQAKDNGKNSIAFYSKELATSMRRRMEIEHELHNMDTDKEFYLVYMPLVATKNNSVDGFEVLLRWNSPKLGFVGPDEFVPIAERCGLFEKIDNWVTENAMRQYAQLKESLGRDFKLSINLSSAQLNLNLIGHRLIELIKQHKIPSHCIQLEMTETLSVEFSRQANQFLELLREQGFNVAIDDFGTGHTALLQLVEYPADMIKFDKTFVEKAMEPTNRAMLGPLVSLCHSQGLKVTVEGVETKEMASYLTDIGCDYLQGYYFGKPAKLEDLKLENF